MTVWQRSMLRTGLRFVVAATIYAATATIWVRQASGWASLGLFIGALAFGVIAAAAWCAAVVIGHCYVRNPWMRLIAHPALTTALFAISAVVMLAGFLGDSTEAAWREAKPFGTLVVVCALADAAAGVALDRIVSPRPARPS